MKSLLVLIIVIIVVFTLLGVPLITSVILSISVLTIIVIFSLLNKKDKSKKGNNVLKNNIIESKPIGENKILFINNKLIKENIHDLNKLSISEISNTNLNNQICLDEKIKQEKLGRILNELTIYINNKDVIDNETSIKLEQISEDSLLQERAQIHKVEEELERKRIIGNILRNLIHCKRGGYANISNTSDNLYVDDESIIDITNMESYSLDYNDLYAEDTLINSESIEIESDNDIPPDYSKNSTRCMDGDEELGLTKYSQSIPYWEHTYIYSTNDLYYASESIKKFYSKYEEEFQKGVYINLEGNTNYSFTLMFDLLAKYDTHQNLILLTNQMQALIKHYPETQYYAESNLIRKAKILGRRRAIFGTTEVTIDDLIELFPDSREWSFLDKYSNQLGLSIKEMELLEYIGTKWSSFYSPFDFLTVKAIHFFKLVIKEIDKRYYAEGSDIEIEFTKVAELFELRNSNQYYDYNLSRYINNGLSKDERIKEIYNCIYRLCRNKLLKKYGFDYDIDIYESLRSKDSKTALVKYVMPITRAVVKELVKLLPEFSDEEEIIINERYSTRWRPVFQKLTDQFDGNISIFLENINTLLKRNQNNPGQRYLLFDTAKFLTGKDDVTALKMYIKYISAQHKFTNDNEKPLPQYIYKKLFKTIEQRAEFDNIIDAYKSDENISKAYSKLEVLFTPKRKKINLNHSEINKITVQHSDTVKLLNEVMDEDQIIIEKQAPMIVEVQSNSTNTSDSSINSIIDSEQQELLDIFVKNNFTLKKSEVETFAKSKNLMANRLIEKINDLCYEVLDDVLIEEEEDSWTILEDYLKQILVL